MLHPYWLCWGHLQWLLQLWLPRPKCNSHYCCHSHWQDYFHCLRGIVNTGAGLLKGFSSLHAANTWEIRKRWPTSAQQTSNGSLCPITPVKWVGMVGANPVSVSVKVGDLPLVSFYFLPLIGEYTCKLHPYESKQTVQLLWRTSPFSTRRNRDICAS